MVVTRTEQQNIKQSNSIYKIVDEYCFKSKNVYNYVNYIIRQEFIHNNKWIRKSDLDKMCQSEDCYKELGSQASQKIIQLLDQNWKSFFAAIKDWKKHPNKYLGRPRLPKYKDKNGRQIFMLKNIQCSLSNGLFRISFKPFKGYTVPTHIPTMAKLMQCRFIPHSNYYTMEIVYQIDVPETISNSEHIASIDLGVDNFATITNNIGLKPIAIKGGIIKSINQYYNKNRSVLSSKLKTVNNNHWSKKLQQLTNKRNNKIKYYMHNVSKYIVDYCVLYSIDTLVCGYNAGWKQKSKINHIVNQTFECIPYFMFVNQLAYKCESNGIKFITTDESYTSGTSFLDCEEPIKVNYDKNRRIHRGMFKSNNGTLINADVNGSYQIMKKVFPNAFANGIEGVGLHPLSTQVA